MKRVVLITTLVLGTLLVLAPAANAVVLSADSGGAGGGLVFHTDVLGGNGSALATASQPGVVTDGWMSSITPSVTLRPDVLGGNGGPSAQTPIATGGNSFAWGDAALLATILAGTMLLALATLTLSRRRHSLSY